MKNSEIFSVLIIALIHQSEAISLNGIWTVDLEDFDLAREFDVTVPGGIYSDLFNANLIPDTFFNDNDVKNRWISKRSVSYTRNFEVNQTILEAPKVLLVFYGIDTFATISVNHREIGKTSNMFLRYVFDVKEYLQVGQNHLNVTIASPVNVAKDLFKKQSASYIVPPTCVPSQYNGECHVNHIRKSQASFSWDWGPAVPSMGIWKSVELVPVNELMISDVSVDVIDSGMHWNVSLDLIIEPQDSKTSADLSLKLLINEDQSLDTSKKMLLDIDALSNRHWITLVVPKSSVELWWPNGYGDQKLYTLNIKIETQTTYVELEKRIGFRTIELAQYSLTKGRSFYFKVNGVPIFAKGSNWIPASIYPEWSAEEDVVKHLLTSSRDVHMNMLRVWGGGYYESDYFYDLADEYGIMIWQDFMFACSMYPTNDEFMASVSEEVRQNVLRLKHHPSIVIWAGNNENEAALYGNWYGTSANSTIYKEDYYKLYVMLIKREVEMFDSTRPFVVSSPSDGSWTDENGSLGPDPYSNFYGDVHYYNYLRDGWDINQYPIPRFSSEYGFQSIPSLETLKSATNDYDLTMDSEFMRHRQHLPGGSSFMKILISRNLRIPETDDKHRDFEDYIYLSQIHQAVSMRIQSESYRQMKSSTNELGEGMTMGALYWQLNDVWQAPSWSSIDFAGRWKMLHYYVQDFFAPVIVSPRLSSANDLTVYVVSDMLSSKSGCQLDLNIHNWNLSRPAYTISFKDIEIIGNSSEMIIQSFWINKLLKDASCGTDSDAAKSCLLEFVLRDGNGELVAPINYLFPAPLKNVNLPKAQVTANINNVTLPGKLSNYLDHEIEVTSQEIALFVWLELPGTPGRFSDNGFHLMNQTKKVVFHAQQFHTAQELFANLQIKTLSQLYDPNR